MAYRPQWLDFSTQIAKQKAKYAESQLLKSQNNAYQATTLAKLTNDRLQPNQNASAIVSSLTGLVSDISKQAQNFGSSVVTGIGQAFDTLPQDLKNGFNELTKNIREFIEQKIDDAKKGIEDFTIDVNERLKGFASEVQKALDNISSGLSDIAKIATNNLLELYLSQIKFFAEIAREIITYVSDKLVDIIRDNKETIAETRKAIEETITVISNEFNETTLALTLGLDNIAKAFTEAWTFDAEKFVSQQIAIQREIAKRKLEYVKTE